jgi:GNAT superfamily N-acetyltransferase
MTGNVVRRYPRVIHHEGGDLEVRYMTGADEAAVLAFAQALPRHDLLFLPRDITQPKVLAAWTHELQCGTLTSLLALRAGTVLGCATIVCDPLSWSAHVGEIRVVVAAETRGSGVGRLLIQEIFRVALGLGVEKLTAQMTALDPQRRRRGGIGRDLFHRLVASSRQYECRPSVFFVTGDIAGVMETRSFLRQRPQADFATQSGPMLVIDGRLHPRFARHGGSRKYRSGVDSRDPSTLVFAVSEAEVSFGDFGRLFRDKLRCKNALFLDGGSATSFYSPQLARNSNLLPLGPMIGVYERAN